MIPCSQLAPCTMRIETRTKCCANAKTAKQLRKGSRCTSASPRWQYAHAFIISAKREMIQVSRTACSSSQKRQGSWSNSPRVFLQRTRDSRDSWPHARTRPRITAALQFFVQTEASVSRAHSAAGGEEDDTGSSGRLSYSSTTSVCYLQPAASTLVVQRSCQILSGMWTRHMALSAIGHSAGPLRLHRTS